jgi:hypothetical protein
MFCIQVNHCKEKVFWKQATNQNKRNQENESGHLSVCKVTAATELNIQREQGIIMISNFS